MTRCLIVGAGNMGLAMARGLSRPDQSAIQVVVFDLNQKRLDHLEQQGIETIQEPPVDETFEILLLCTKPQDLPRLALWAKDSINENSLVLSILAGVLIDDVRSALEHQGPVVRAMPNIAAVVGQAATAVCASPGCEEKHRHLADKVFSAIGVSCWTRESLLDAVTGLSGSGPAYIYMMIEALIDGAVRVGLPRQLATDLAAQTVRGAAEMVQSSKCHPAILKDQVTTPGGTTIHALHEMESKGFRSILMDAVSTATMQSARLGQKAREDRS